MSKNKSVLVHLIKSYDYPLAALDKINPNNNAIELARQDMMNEIQHIVNNDFNHGFPDNFFAVDVVTEETNHLRETVKQQYTGGRGNYVEKIKLKTAANVITELLFEAKYGPLDQTKNPDIYEPGRIKNILKAEQSNFYNDTWEKTFRILKLRMLKELYNNRERERF